MMDNFSKILFLLLVKHIKILNFELKMKIKKERKKEKKKEKENEKSTFKRLSKHLPILAQQIGLPAGIHRDLYLWASCLQDLQEQEQ